MTGGALDAPLIDRVRLSLLDASADATPASVGQRVVDTIGAGLGCSWVEFSIVDYMLRWLHPVAVSTRSLLRRAMPVEDSVEGDVFVSQQAHQPGPGAVLVLPVTVRGHRLGVLCLVLPDAVGEVDLAALERLAALVGLVVSDASGGTDVFETRRRSARLSVAAEMQWQLLPPRGLATPRLSLYGQLEPAELITSDLFDWSQDPGGVHLTLLDAAGRGLPAAQAGDLALTALRNARRAELPLDEQAALADQAVHDQLGGRRSVDALLLHLDLENERASAVEAGSPSAIRVRNGQADVLDLDHQLPLGMFERSPYVLQAIDLRPGDRLLAVTDGVMKTVDAAGRAFGFDGVLAVLHDPDVPSWDLARAIVAATRRHAEDRLPEDASCVVVDWR